MNAVSWLDAMGAPEKWRGTLQSRGPQLAVWLLALAIGVQGALILIHLTGTARPAGHTAFVPAPAAAPRIDVAAITRSHLFGEAPVAQVASDAAHAPPTSIPLVLTGIIAAREPKDGFAIVGANAASAKVYAVGDNIPGGARLNAVYSDRVLLDRGGRIEALMLPRQYSSGPARVSAAPNMGGEAADRVRRVITEQPGLIADVMRPQPVFADGKQRGYRVYPGRNTKAFMQLGLRPGDLVVSINSTPLDDPARGDEIFRTLGSSSEARVTVMRNGHQQDLTLNMSQLATEADQLAGQDAGAGAPPQGAPAATQGPPAPAEGQPPAAPSQEQ
jgi:general secretion pathway protein C